MVSKVLITGATGDLGEKIAHAFLKKPQEFETTLIIRKEGIANKREKVDQFRAKGAKIIEGDLDNLEDLARACKGQDYVVSSAAIVHLYAGQETKLIKAAHEAGVKRFMPSQYTSDYNLLPKEELMTAIHYEHLIGAVQKIEETGMEWTCILNGNFNQYQYCKLQGFDPQAGIVTCVEDGNHKISAMSTEDIGRFIPEIIVDPFAKNRYIRLEGHTYTRRQIKTIAEEIWGKKFELINFTIDEIIKQREDNGKFDETWAPRYQELFYKWNRMANFEGISDNWRYPNVVPQPLHAWFQHLKDHPDQYDYGGVRQY
eukprot:TRINITY_DN5851_c0_g1_i2.p1 TRINITY_DN5851_c0_g1~~TRINITY_DN5851_c0_g1_i2.p1  ORF type:complete len:314 (-),score=89.95 TRINITY_DN5851_c0_g1_i2:56-997(-)